MLPRFDYVRPRSLKALLSILEEKKKEAKVFAGGTDLFVQMKKGLIHPHLLADIKALPHLSKISLTRKGDLTIGASVTLEVLERWAKARKDWFALSIAAGCVGSEQIRNRGTVVGNVCRASPAGDMAPMLIALDGGVEIQGIRGKKVLSVEEFITGPGETLLRPGEIVTCLRIPKPEAMTTAVYLKLGARRAMDTAIVAIAVRLTLDKTSKKVRRSRIVLGAVAPKPIRVHEAEELLVKQGLMPGSVEEASVLAKRYSRPITDLRGTEGYRAEMVRVLTRRAITQAWETLTGKEVKA